ncbi:hypothetical protein [Amycolatopsis xylanica]|uniref:hypothetical protein n=1 Tax=Amycolatopsis xylanica TaxID=589385 RepID=UPI00115FBDC8|nr:hypothetical protein [Amycolatopsis xylanica]
MPRTVAVIGSGSLARAVVYSLADVLTEPVDVHLLARSSGPLATMAHIATRRSALLGGQARFTAHPLDTVVAGAEVVLNCSSTHSSAEARVRPSAWTDLIKACGIALALPFHAAFAARMSRIAGDALFVNAAFPDAVNPVLAALSLPIHCGAGNIATLAASAGGDIRMLAHHYHLSTPPRDEARMWIGADEVTDVRDRLAPLRACERPMLNDLTGHTAALLVRDLLREGPIRTHVPGPLGLPGGYPVLLEQGRIELDLPPGVSEADAVAWQLTWGALDGVAVDRRGRATYSDHVLEAAERYVKLPSTMEPAETIAFAEELDLVRKRLRGNEY